MMLGISPLQASNIFNQSGIKLNKINQICCYTYRKISAPTIACYLIQHIIYSINWEWKATRKYWDVEEEKSDGAIEVRRMIIDKQCLQPAYLPNHCAMSNCVCIASMKAPYVLAAAGIICILNVSKTFHYWVYSRCRVERERERKRGRKKRCHFIA